MSKDGISFTFSFSLLQNVVGRARVWYTIHMTLKLSPEIPVLQEISSVVVRERNVRTLLEKVLDILERRMGMLRGTVTLLEGDELRIEASRGLEADERALGRYRIGEGVTGRVAQTGKSEIVPDIHADRRFLNRTGARSDARPIAFICVPLVHLGQVIGTLSIDRLNEPGTTAADDLARDRKRGAFNPFAQERIDTPEARRAFAARVRGMLNLTQRAALDALDALQAPRFGEILENIVLDGLDQSAARVLAAYEGGAQKTKRFTVE